MMDGAGHREPLRVGKKMRKRRELDALVGVAGGRGGRLLSASSDEEEPWGRRTSRKRRSRPFLRFAAVLNLCICIVSAATLLWLFVDVRRQIVSLRIEMDRVTISSNDVGTDLQRCHTAAKELRYNVTDLNDRITELELSQKELYTKVDQACNDLAAVTKQLEAAPKLADTPRRLGELQRTVANFGSQLSGFDASFASAREQALSASTGLSELKTSLHQLEERVNETIVNVKNTEELKKDINTINTTLVQRIDTLSARVQDNTKVSTTVLPSTSTSTTASSTTSSTTIVTPTPSTTIEAPK